MLGFKNAKTFGQIRSKLPGVHIEICRSKGAAAKYCSKAKTSVGGSTKRYTSVEPSHLTIFPDGENSTTLILTRLPSPSPVYSPTLGRMQYLNSSPESPISDQSSGSSTELDVPASQLSASTSLCTLAESRAQAKAVMSNTTSDSILTKRKQCDLSSTTSRDSPASTSSTLPWKRSKTASSPQPSTKSNNTSSSIRTLSASQTLHRTTRL